MDRLRARRSLFVAAVPRLLAREYCFYACLLLLIAQALWFAFSARYPMAFDENFHFGLIKLHAQQWVPFFTSQPPGASVYGPAVRDPSYIYHFLMSIPYRLIARMTPSETAQIIALRILNIALFTYGLILMRRLLARLGGSRALNHTIMLLFCLVPIVPFLAAHINYDNMFIPLTWGSLLLMFSWIDRLRSNRRVPIAQSIVLASLLLLASLVKYPFLPIALGIGGVCILILLGERAHWRIVWRHAREDLEHIPVMHVLVLTFVLGTSIGLWGERYGVNIMEYHSPTPDCAAVLNIQSCLAYGPWARDYGLAQDAAPLSVLDKLSYIWQWFAGMWQRCFFAISDQYVVRYPLPLPGIVTIILAAVGTVLTLRYWRVIFRRHGYLLIAFAVTLLYVLVLFASNYEGYLKTGVAVAVNGRYLLPVLPVIMLVAGLGFRQLWQHRPGRKALAVVLVLFLFLQGGGVMTFILRSDQSWDWQNPTVMHINNGTRDVLRQIVIGAKSYF